MQDAVGVLQLMDGPIIIGDRIKPTSAGVLLQLHSTTQGWAPPKMTTVQRDAIPAPFSGLEIYNIDVDLQEYYNGVGWVAIGSGAGGVLEWIPLNPYVIDTLVWESERIYKALDAHTSTGDFATDLLVPHWIEMSDDLNKEASGTVTDNALTRWDTTSGDDVQDSLAILDDLGALSGLTQLTVDSLDFNGDVISSTGDLVFTPTSDFIITGFTQGSIPFFGATANLIEDNPNLFWDDTNNKLGVGTVTPADAISIVGGSGGNIMMSIEAFNNNNVNDPHLELKRALGAVGAPTRVLSGVEIGTLSFHAHDGTNFVLSSNIRSVVEESFTIVLGSTNLEFLVNPVGATDQALALTLNADSSADFVSDITTPTNANIRTINYTPKTTQVITAATDTITSSNSHAEISGASDFIMTSTPTLVVGVDGQLIILHNTGSNAIELQDDADLAGSDIFLGGGTGIINPQASLSLIFSTTTGGWVVAGGSGGGGGIDLWETSKNYKIDNIVHESNKIYKALTDHTSGVFATDLGNNEWIELSDDLNRETSVTDNALTRWDGTGGDDVQDSLAILDDLGVLTGLTSLTVDNLVLDANTLTTLDANGPLLLDANGTGNIVVLADNISQRTNTDLDNPVGQEFRSIRNYYTKGDAAYGKITDFVTGSNAIFDNGGTFDAGNTFEVSVTASKLIDGPRVYRFVQDTGAQDDFIVTEIITIPQGHRGGEIGYEFRYKYDGDDDDIAFKAKCTTSGDLITTLGATDLLLPKFITSDGGSQPVGGSIFVKSDCTQVEVGFQVITENNTAELLWDSMKVTPDISVSGKTIETQDVHFTAIADHGSVDTKIAEFGSIQENVGASIFVIANDSTNGLVLTATRIGSIDLTLSVEGNASANGAFFGFSKNSTQLTTDIQTITAINRKGLSQIDANSRQESTTAHFNVIAGDTIRVHTNGSVTIETSGSFLTFHATAQIDSILTPAFSNLTDPSNFTPVLTNFGTISNEVGKTWRIGKFMYGEGSLICGSTAVLDAKITIPNGLLIDVSAISGGDSNHLGSFGRTDGGSAYMLNAGYTGMLFSDGIDNNELFFSFSGSATKGIMDKDPASSVCSVTHGFFFRFRVPIVGWDTNSNSLFNFPRDRTAYIDVDASNYTDSVSGTTSYKTVPLISISGDTSFISINSNQASLSAGTYKVKFPIGSHNGAGFVDGLIHDADAVATIEEFLDVVDSAVDAISFNTITATFTLTQQTDIEFQTRAELTAGSEFFSRISITLLR